MRSIYRKKNSVHCSSTAWCVSISICKILSFLPAMLYIFVCLVCQEGRVFGYGNRQVKKQREPVAVSQYKPHLSERKVLICRSRIISDTGSISVLSTYSFQAGIVSFCWKVSIYSCRISSFYCSGNITSLASNDTVNCLWQWFQLESCLPISGSKSLLVSNEPHVLASTNPPSTPV